MTIYLISVDDSSTERDVAGRPKNHRGARPGPLHEAQAPVKERGAMKADDRTTPGDGVGVPEHLARDLDRDDLSRLIREANAAGVSFATMEARAGAAGHPLSRSQFNKLALNTVKTSPTDEALAAIAAGITKPFVIVARAAARQYLRYEATGLSGYGEDVRIIVAHLAGMPPDSQRRWRAMIEADERTRSHQEESPDAE
ncbi:hypothetical protein ACIQNG_25465 [Streptomyces sp. NPDC091377]|uniref:hypothetical protein n=1 Tax=Streptomyces sp. NPDC091377 TaxID=3365995 RepID=UPI00380C6296